MKTKEKTYPEHEKLSEVQKESQFLGAFLEWAKEKDMSLCEYSYDEREYHSTRKSINQLLGEYLNIDLVKLEKEKQEMLKEIRKGN